VQARFGDFALVAGAFTFLPTLIWLRFAPDNPGGQLVVGLIGLVGQLSVIRLVVRPASDTGDSIRAAFAVYLPALGLTLAVGVAAVIGFLALVVPGFYVLARLIYALPALVVGEGGIETSLRGSWSATKGSAIPILGVVIAFFLMFFIAAFLAGGIAAAISGGGQPTLLGAVLVSAVAATFSTYYSVLQGTVWRALAVPA